MSRRRKRTKTLGDVIRLIVMLAALAVFLYSGYTLYGFYKEYKKSSDEYDNLENSYAVDQEQESENIDNLEDDDALQSISGQEVRTVLEGGEEKTLPVLKNPIDFTQLLSVNSDIVGWLRIRALDISYPVVQGKDNDYYLHRTFEKTDNFAGCLFVNSYNMGDFTDQNTIIYGHNMKNGSMFASLEKYKKQAYYEEHPVLYLLTPEKAYRLVVFAGFVTASDSDVYTLQFGDAGRQDWIDRAKRQSDFQTDVQVREDEPVVTLSTCDYTYEDARYVVLGVLR